MVLRKLIKDLRSVRLAKNRRVLIVYFLQADTLDEDYKVRLAASLNSLVATQPDVRLCLAEYSAQATMPPELIAQYQLEYVHYPADLPFNRSWCINFAFKYFVNKRDTHLMFTDLDLVFPPDFLKKSVDALADRCGILVPNVYYLDAGDCVGELDYASLSEVKGKAWREFYGGACLCPVELFWRVKGFDERYSGWGAEDNDFINRISSVGGEVLKLNELEVLHLDHPRTAELQTEIVRRNRMRLRLKEAGEIPMIENHPWGGDRAPPPMNPLSEG